LFTIKDICNTRNNLILATFVFLLILLYLYNKIQNYIQTESTSNDPDRRKKLRILYKRILYWRLKYTKYFYVIFIFSMWNDWIYLGNVCTSFPRIWEGPEKYTPVKREFCWMFTQFFLKTNWAYLDKRTCVKLIIMSIVFFLCIFVYTDITKLETQYFYNVFWCSTNWLRHLAVSSGAFQFGVYEPKWIARQIIYEYLIILILLLIILLQFNLLTKYKKLFKKISQIFTFLNLIHWFILGLYSILFTYYAPFWPYFDVLS
jgi:hypothetical protein